MRLRVPHLAALCLALLSTTSRPHASALSGESLIESMVEASGIEDPGRRTEYVHRMEEALRWIRGTVGEPRSQYRAARRLHAALHGSWLRRYRAEADGVASILDDGSYNCVSATLFYGAAARAVGIEAFVVEAPRHLILRLVVDGRPVDVEATAPDGFDIARDLSSFRRLAIIYKLATPAELEARGDRALFEEYNRLSEPATLEASVGFAWFNAAERALELRDAPAAASSLEKAATLLPGLVERDDRIGSGLSRAFRIEFEAGRFDEAYRIAAIETELFPGRTGARDRLLGSAIKRIQEAAEAGEAPEAERILQAASRHAPAPADAARLDRAACPMIAAAAVRAGMWDIAARAAERYTSAESDRTEAQRLAEWIESRRAAVERRLVPGVAPSGSSPMTPACEACLEGP